LYAYFKKSPPESLFLGKINFTGLPMSSSKVRVLIEEGKYSGWDDMRLPFLLALSRRGYQPEAFISYALDVGVTQNDKTVSASEFFKSLNHFNKEIIDEKADRYFFILKPKKIVISGAPDQEVSLDLHPNFPKRGKRKFKTGDTFFIEEEDFKNIKEGSLIRLMDCLNFKMEKGKFIFDSLEYEIFKKKGTLIIHWLPASSFTTASLMLEDNTLVEGYAEEGIKDLKEGSIVQFERKGFVRLDDSQKKIFWYGHR